MSEKTSPTPCGVALRLGDGSPADPDDLVLPAAAIAWSGIVSSSDREAKLAELVEAAKAYLAANDNDDIDSAIEDVCVTALNVLDAARDRLDLALAALAPKDTP